MESKFRFSWKKVNKCLLHQLFLNFLLQNIILIFQFFLKVPDSSFIVIIATLEDYQSTKVYTTGLGGFERYHRLDLYNFSIPQQGQLCYDSYTKEVVEKSMSKMILLK